MAGQPGLIDLSDRYAALSAAGNPLQRLASAVNFEVACSRAASIRGACRVVRCPEHIARANAKRSAVRCAVEHVFAGQKHRMGLLIRTIGIARVRTKIGMSNRADHFKRLAWLEGRGAPARRENEVLSRAPAPKAKETGPETMHLNVLNPRSAPALVRGFVGKWRARLESNQRPQD